LYSYGFNSLDDVRILLWGLTDLDGPSIAVILGAFPLCAYTGIIVADAGMVDLQDLRPYLMRIFPSKRRQLAALPHKRKQLQEDLRLFIKTMGPQFGEIYYGKNVDWQQQMRRIDSKETPLSAEEPKKIQMNEVNLDVVKKDCSSSRES
jgi:hypothetical protein